MRSLVILLSIAAAAVMMSSCVTPAQPDLEAAEEPAAEIDAPDFSSMASMEVWQSVAQTESIVEFFRYLFESIGIRVVDTGEEFTCRHLGDSICFVTGFDEAGVDYVVEIERFQVERLARYGTAGSIASSEQYRVMKVVFTPATAALLENKALATPFFRWVSGAEDVIHATLLSPLEDESDVSHTIAYQDKAWNVTPGLHGNPARVYAMTLADAIEFQKRANRAASGGIFAVWGFAQWYRTWREGVSVRM